MNIVLRTTTNRQTSVELARVQVRAWLRQCCGVRNPGVWDVKAVAAAIMTADWPRRLKLIGLLELARPVGRAAR
jgi:hypothetical protein